MSYDIPLITLRLGLAVLCGGVIGFERGQKGRPAGLRTHILVCLGSALAMVTNQHIFLNMTGDPTRLGAQVISGIGFLGAGTIIVTGNRQVKGLTTAAGLWASACMGLALGIGYYQAALIACFFIWFVSSGLHNLDAKLASRSNVLEVYAEFENPEQISRFIVKARSKELQVVEIEHLKTAHSTSIGAVITVRAKYRCKREEIMNLLSELPGVSFLELL